MCPSLLYLPVMFVMFLSCRQTISRAFYIGIANTGVTTNCYSVIWGQIMAPGMIQMIRNVDVHLLLLFIMSCIFAE